MQLNKLETIYNWINNLGPNIKTIIIIALTVVVFGICFDNYTKSILQDFTEQVKEDKRMAEKYTEIITPYVNDYCDKILAQDKEATNVILLTYHNTVTSTNGLSYKYLTSIAEKRQGFDSKSCLKIWKELDYINYGEELERINRSRYLRMDSVENYKKYLPNITELLQLCEAHSAAFYPITGVDCYIGMLVILYPKKKIYSLGYYQSTITPSIQPLAILLDYNSMKKKFKELREEDDIELHNLLN